jgi:hypothetical protein
VQPKPSQLAQEVRVKQPQDQVEMRAEIQLLEVLSRHIAVVVVGLAHRQERAVVAVVNLPLVAQLLVLLVVEEI